jgi:hypothetical protein
VEKTKTAQADKGILDPDTVRIILTLIDKEHRRTEGDDKEIISVINRSFIRVERN